MLQMLLTRVVGLVGLVSTAAGSTSCVGPAGLSLAFGSYPPTGPTSDLCPAFSSDCAALKYHEEGCDTCGKSNVGFTADTSMTLGEGLTVSVMAKPASSSFFYGELVGQGGAFNLGWYPARGVSGCSPGYAPGMKVGEWNHIVLRYTQTSCTLYVNGARHDGRENLKSISSRVGGKIAPAIGCRGPASGQGGACEGDYHFSGDRGEVGATAIWDRALSDGEVSALTLEGANSLTTAMCSKPTTTTTTTAAPSGALQAMANRLAAVEASNAALAEKLARFEALEAKLQQLSLLKVEKTGSLCTVQCDNGRNSGILELD